MPRLSGVAVKRLAKEWQRLREAPGDGADAITGGPVAEEDMSVWTVKCTNLDHKDASAKCKAVARELKARGHEPAIEFRMHFPEHYPADPPFVYVHRPCIGGGHIHANGAMCLDVLYPSGWTPANKVDTLLRTVRSDIDDMYLPPSWANADGTMRCNLEALARSSAKLISQGHQNWDRKVAEPHKPAKRPRVQR